MTILEEIKVYCEVEDTDQYDTQLIRLINNEIANLKSNGIPVNRIDSTTESFDGLIKPEDLDTILEFIGLSVMRKFDKTMFTDASYTSNNWIDGQLEYLIYQLKCSYDLGDNS